MFQMKEEGNTLYFIEHDYIINKMWCLVRVRWVEVDFNLYLFLQIVQRSIQNFHTFLPF